jgi:hypothetical protein
MLLLLVGPLLVPIWVADRLDNGLGVENEEQGLPVTVCTGRIVSWDDAWARFAHLD